MFINNIQTIAAFSAAIGVVSIICHTGIIINTLSNNTHREDFNKNTH